MERPSTAENIDRSEDQPDSRFRGATEWDGERVVELDTDDLVVEDGVPGDEFWREQRPPHHD